MKPSDRQTRYGRKPVMLLGLLLLLDVMLIGATPFTATAVPIYESAAAASPGLRGDSPEERMSITQLQSLGVAFHVSTPVTTGSIGGYFAEYNPGTPSEIVGAIVRLHGPYDFPDSFDLTTPDVLGTTSIHISDSAGDFAGDLSLRLTGGWYALVFAAAGVRDGSAAIMPGVNEETGDPLYFFSRPAATENGFEYVGGRGEGGLDGVRMFVDSDPATSVPEPSTLLLLGSGLAGLGGAAWRRHRQN